MREQTVTADLRDGRRTTSSSIAYRRLAPADELRRIRPGEGVLVYGYLPAGPAGACAPGTPMPSCAGGSPRSPPPAPTMARGRAYSRG